MSQPIYTDRDPNVTQLLAALRAGDESARARLFSVVYEQLRGIASARMARVPASDTLQATALVHEAWIKLAGREADAQDRQHFLSIAARAMRDVVVDQARRHASAKRGGELRRVTLAGDPLNTRQSALDVLDVDDAIERLRSVHPLGADIVTLRFFGGMSIDEVADSLQVSPSAVDRGWAHAKAWMSKQLGASSD